MKAHFLLTVVICLRTLWAGDYPGAVDFSFTPGTPVADDPASYPYDFLQPAYRLAVRYASNSTLAFPSRRQSLGQAHLFDEDGVMHHFIHNPDTSIFFREAAMQPDGKVLVITSILGIQAVQRLNRDGTFDNSFKTIPVQSARQIEPLLDGRFVLLSDVVRPSATNQGSFNLKRFTSEGKPDPIFFGLEGLSFVPEYLSAQSDGRLIVASESEVARLDQYGIIDPQFKGLSNLVAPPHATVNQGIFNVLAAANGGVYVGGAFTSIGGFPSPSLIRLKNDGTLDSGFTFWKAASASSFVSGFAENASGLLAIGFDSGNDFATKVGSSGSRQMFSTTFNGAASVIALSNYFVLAGLEARNGLARLVSDGSVDSNFNYKPPASVFGIYPIGSNLLAIDKAAAFTLSSNGVRLSQVSFRSNISACAKAPDNTFLISRVGYVSSLFGPPQARLMRYIPGATTAISFGPTFREFSQINRLIVRRNGKILVTGQFDAVKRTNYMQLNADGSIDGTWPPLPSTPLALTENQNGSILAALPEGLVRLDQSGQIDPLYTPPKVRFITPFQTIRLAPSASNEVFVFGDITFDQTGQTGITKLKSTGEIDSSFAASLSGSPLFLKELSDGRILAGILTYRCSMVRLQPDGKQDETFRPVDLESQSSDGIGVTTVVETELSDLLIGGNFGTVNHLDFPGIVRVRGDGALKPLHLEIFQTEATQQVNFSGNPARQLVVEQSTNLVDWTKMGSFTNFSGNLTLDAKPSSIRKFLRAYFSQL